MYVMRLDTTPTWTRYHQLRQSRQLMIQQKHHQRHQYGYKTHQLQSCMHEYMTQH